MTSERTIMMLKKMTQRLTKRVKGLEVDLALKDKQIQYSSERIAKLIDRIRGAGAKAPVSAEYLPSYTAALDYVTALKYKEGHVISWFKDPKNSNKRYAEVKGATIVDWKVTKIADDIWDLEKMKEWSYE